MPELSLNLDPLGGLWPVIPAQAATPDDELAIDFGALLQVQARLDEPPVPTADTPHATPKFMTPEIEPVVPYVAPPAMSAAPAVPAQRTVKSVELIETPASPLEIKSIATDADAIEGEHKPIDLIEVIARGETPVDVDQAPPVVPDVVTQTTQLQGPRADATPTAQGAPAPALAPSPGPEPAPALALAPAPGPAPVRTPVPEALPAPASTSAPASAPAPAPAPASAPGAASGAAPAAAPAQSAPATAQFRTAPVVAVETPQKGKRTEPSVDRVNHSGVARVATPHQQPAAAAPRVVDDPDIAPVITAAPLVMPDAQVDAPQRVAESTPSTAPTVFSTGSGPQAPQSAQPVTPTVAQAPLQAMVPTTEDGAPVMPRLIEMMRWQAQEGGGQAELRLRPEFLGAVTVSIVVEHGAVKAIVSAETPAALEYLRAESSGLQEALEERGLTLDEFEVREESPLAERRRDADDAPPRKETAPPAPRRRVPDVDGEAVFNVLM